MRRVSIIGASGSGKTTLAKTLAERLGVPHVELDALHWGPGWTSTPTDALVLKVDVATAGDGWCVCGSYGKDVRAIVWSRADTIVWLDYSLAVTFGRLIPRTVRRCWTRELLWADNRERFWMQLFHRDSLWWYVLKRWRRRRRDYAEQLAQQAERGKAVYRFRRPADTARWLAGVATQPRPGDPKSSV